VSKRRLRLGFAAPEQFEPGAADARADVFTLGALLYFAATGHTVGPSSSADDYARAAAALEPAALAGVDGLPADLRHLITICLAPDPSWRPASAAAVLHAAETLGLEATRDGDPLSTLRPRPATVRPGPMLPLEIDDAVLANRQPRPPRARLEPITGFTADIVLAAPSVTIGRLDSNAVQIDHPTISKRHARLWFEDGRYRFEDVGSRNGSSVNGRRVTGRVALADGDVVAMGEVVCRFRVEVS
jgi:serine/threonine protein kinase